MKNNKLKKCGIVMPTKVSMKIETWSIDRLIFYVCNPRKNDAAVDRMCSSIREFGFKIPCLIRSDGEVIDGHLRLKAARKLGIKEIPVILCDEWTPAQVKAFRLMVNRSATWADWDEDLLKLELLDLKTSNFELALTGFDTKEIDELILNDVPEEDALPPVPVNPVSCVGDLWICDSHRLLCGDATDPQAVSRLLRDQKPFLMVVDPPYGIELDSEWRDRANLNKRGPAEPSYLKHRTTGHQETKISGDTRADWSEAFALVPSLEVAYVWHASSGMLRNSRARFLMGCYESASYIISRSFGTRGARCSPGPTIGLPMNRRGTSARKMLAGTGRRARTRRSGIHRHQNLLWADRRKRNSITLPKNQSR